MTNPPYRITPEILSLVAEISTLIGRIEGRSVQALSPKLRRRNQIQTVHGTVAIEGNRLTESQITAILDGKRVRGSANQIREVKNAIKAYQIANEWNPFSERHFLKAHLVLMEGLISSAGKYRSGNVGVMKGSKVKHVAPKASMVPKLMADLFSFVKAESAPHPLIKSAIFHYEVEFIHPFTDGNGRIGRLWQHVMLGEVYPICRALPVESVICENQKMYYSALEKSDRAGDCNPFLVFSLRSMLSSLGQLERECTYEASTVDDRVAAAKAHFTTQPFSRKEYLAFFKIISSATASRDLSHAVKSGRATSSGRKALTRYRFVDDQSE